MKTQPRSTNIILALAVTAFAPIANALEMRDLVGHWAGRVQDGMGNYYPCTIDIIDQDGEIVVITGNLLMVKKFDVFELDGNTLNGVINDTPFGRLTGTANVDTERKVMEFQYNMPNFGNPKGDLAWQNPADTPYVPTNQLRPVYSGTGSGSAFTPPTPLLITFDSLEPNITGTIRAAALELPITNTFRHHNRLYIEAQNGLGIHGFVVATIKNPDELDIFWHIGPGTGGASLLPGADNAKPLEQTLEQTGVHVAGGQLEFAIKDLQGQLHTFPSQQYEGKVILVDIWGTWCPPCRAAIPHFSELYKKFQPQGFEIIAIAFENEDSTPTRNRIITYFVQDHDIPYTVLNGGTTGTVQQHLKNLRNFSAFPTAILIGRDGLVKHIDEGFSPNMIKPLETKITELLAQQP